MELYTYIKENFKIREPILLSELKDKFGENSRQYANILIKQGKLRRYLNGVYYLPFQTILGTEGTLLLEDYLKKKYLIKDNLPIGYITGGQLANDYGITTQNFQTIEIKTNVATTKQRSVVINGRKVVIKQPVVPITVENLPYLQLLDLIYEYNRYNELNNKEMLIEIKRKVDYQEIDPSNINKYIQFYPEKIYRQLYEGGFYELLEKR